MSNQTIQNVKQVSGMQREAVLAVILDIGALLVALDPGRYSKKETVDCKYFQVCRPAAQTARENTDDRGTAIPAQHPRAHYSGLG